MLAFLLSVASAQALPPELEPWVEWVEARHPELHCPVIGDSAACIWPGLLTIDADDSGAQLTLGIAVDREIDAILPGGPGAWPQGLTADGRPAVVVDSGGKPWVHLAEGTHQLAWSTRWAGVPQGLDLPPTTGAIRLTVRGHEVAAPAMDGTGVLRLGSGAGGAAIEDRVEIDVSRQVQDGVPLRVTTRLAVRAAGSPREIALGPVLVAGTRPVALAADLPARLESDGRLILQLRPGDYTVTLDALHEGPVTELAAPTVPAPWPVQEVWAFKADDRVRAINLSGPPGVDPARTTLPTEWRGSPTWLVDPGTPLRVEELRRGEPEPAPNQLVLDRELWLDADGRGLTVRDTFTGTMHRDWRLDVLPPAVLGHAAAESADQVVTEAGGRAGVELRSVATRFVAESRIEARPSALPAIGWATDVTRLSARLHLQPGWRLWGTWGVDGVSGPIAPWSLFDLFFVLVLSLALGRLLGWPWALVALAGLGLARHEVGAPTWSWVALLVNLALLRVVPEGTFHRVLQGTRAAFVLLLLLLLAPFATGQIRTSVFPALANPWAVGTQSGLVSTGDFTRDVLESAASTTARGPGSWDDEGQVGKGEGGGEGKMSRKYDYLTVQNDPTEVVQTGPGVPTWQWVAHTLTWSGPVTSDHEIRLLLLGPTGNLVLAFLRVGLLLALALKLTGVHRIRWEEIGRAAPLALFLLLPGVAFGEPSAATLAELEARLVAPPACRPTCASASSAKIAMQRDQLVVTAEVHAAAASSWPLPGPTGTWVPRQVLVDGRPTVALARQPDGFLHVRLAPGLHVVRAEGSVPQTDLLTLQFGLSPRHVAFEGVGWTVQGLRADGTTESTVQLVREQESEGPGSSSDNLTPWLEVRRYVDLGLPWRVRTQVVRVGPATEPVAIQIPLIPGESVTTAGMTPVDGAVRVTLDRDVTERTILSTLPTADSLVLTAPSGVPWTEEWAVSCSPIFRCGAEGPAPLRHEEDGRWAPVWRPWPGERVTLGVARPDAVAGQTVTLDRADLEWTPGRRLGEAKLSLSVRTSQGGQLPLTLPADARLQAVTLDGVPRPLQLRDGGLLPLPIQPGAQAIVVTWQQPHSPTVFDQVPAIHVGSPAVNVSVLVHAPEERWIIGLSGPRWGPTPLYWMYVLIVLIAAPLLARLPFAPLKTWQWVLLGLGMTQVPAIAPAWVAITLLALGLRRRAPPKSWWAHDLAQLGLLFLILGSLVSLYAAIHAGLLFQPDSQVQGNGSSQYGGLRWFSDRVDGDLPRPMVVSAPLWVWRVVMLAWALWLAWTLIGWARWAWGSLGEGGFVRWPQPPPPRQPAPEPEQASR